MKKIIIFFKNWLFNIRKKRAIKQAQQLANEQRRKFLVLSTTYSTNRMGTEIKQYFEANSEALEVMVAVGKKMVSVERNFVTKKTFFKELRKAIEQ